MSMKLFLKSLLVALLVTASAQAVTYTWNGSVSDDWFTAANWTPEGVPAGNATFASADRVIIPAVTTPAVSPVLVGTAGAADARIGVFTMSGGTFTITAGSVLYTQSASGTSNQHTQTGGDIIIRGTWDLGTNTSGPYWMVGTMTIDGGIMTGRRQEFGHQNGAYTLNVINGGRIDQGTGVEYIITAAGSSSNTTQPTYVNIVGSGSSILNGVHTSMDRSWINRRNTLGWVDIRNGGMWRMSRVISGTQNPDIMEYIAADRLRAGDPRETLQITPYSATQNDVQAVRQYKAYSPTPANNGPVTLGTIALSWKQPYGEDLTQPDTVTAEVFCGTYDVNEAGIPTDPNGLLLPSIAGPGLTGKTCNFTTAPAAKYQWRVDLYDPNTSTLTTGDVWYFEVANQAPVVNAGATQYIGLRNGTVNFVSNASVTDDGLPVGASVTYLWTQVSGPATVVIDPNTTLNTSVPLTVTGEYVFQLAANDTALTGTGQVTVNVYADACTAAKAVADPVYAKDTSDLNDDCAVDFKDFAILAGTWRNCKSMDPLDPVCQ